ncbi:hypothetical protein ACQV5M_21615, partial [Leptospira sp. SA-E8]|uniref:hypothetical protein n=1 Tax=Leptospira sp. SA-E8 TaxID=3422259 RepID=UPI003EBBD4D9
MAILVSIDKDLVIRIGNATYQFSRYLDDRKRVQLENQLTGEFKVFETGRFCEKLQSMEFVIVQ